MTDPKNYPTRGTQRIHRLRAEAALGRPLKPNEVVHHADGSKRADAPLVICEGHGYHQTLHRRMRVKAFGGNPNTDAVCGWCLKAKNLSEFAPAPALSTGHSNLCHTCDAEKNALRRERCRDIINAQRRIRHAMKRAACEAAT